MDRKRVCHRKSSQSAPTLQPPPQAVDVRFVAGGQDDKGAAGRLLAVLHGLDRAKRRVRRGRLLQKQLLVDLAQLLLRLVLAGPLAVKVVRQLLERLPAVIDAAEWGCISGQVSGAVR